MDIRQLRYMLMVAEMKSFSKAAEKLYIAQPYLSQYIMKLENQIHVKLFDRTCNPLKLTAAGKDFAEKAYQILQLEKELRDEMTDFSAGKTGTISLGISPIRSSHLLPLLLPVLKAHFPQIHLTLHEGQSSELENWLTQGLTDLAILSLPVESKLFSYENLLKEKVLLLAPLNYPLPKCAVSYKNEDSFPVLDLKLLEREPFILLKKGCALRRIADSLFFQIGCRPNVLLETANYATAHALSAIGAGFTFSTLTIYNTYNNINKPVHPFIVKPYFTRTLAVVYKKNRHLSKLDQSFIDATKDIFNNKYVCSLS